jgi:hypothetical protein
MIIRSLATCFPARRKTNSRKRRSESLPTASELDNAVKVLVADLKFGVRVRLAINPVPRAGCAEKQKREHGLHRTIQTTEAQIQPDVALNRRHGIALTPGEFSAFPVFCNVFKTVLNLGYLLLKHCKFVLKVVRFTSQGRNSAADKEYAFSP